MKTENYHEDNPDFKYLRFSIGNFFDAPFDLKTHEGILRFINPLVTFLEEVTDQGKNVLIHCLAGAHRAGTSACAWLIYKEKLSVGEAIKLA